jgi:hypothetical protein
MKGSITDRLRWNGWFCLLVSLAFLPVVAGGCRKNPEVQATSELAAAFEGLVAEQDAMAATAAFEEGRHKDAIYLLHKVVSRGDLNERQKKAMAGIVGPLMQAVHNDPELIADRKLYRLMELLILQTMGET